METTDCISNEAMQQTKTTQPINTKAIIVCMVLLFITLQIGFHPFYIQYFPTFEKFTWLHHIHGALMASWIFFLVIQPVLIHKKRFAAHRFIGRFSYITAPLMVVSMFLMLKFSYYKNLPNSSIEKEVAGQASTIMQFLSFMVLYALAIIYRKNTFYHVRFMVGTALLMITPTLGRVFYGYFAAEIMYEMYLTLIISSYLWVVDIRKKMDWKPNAIVTGILFSFVSVYHARNTDAWQTVGRLWVEVFY